MIDREEKHLAKKIAAAILLCAVMVMIAAAPLATADTHHVVKGAQGPRASSVTWEYVPVDYGTWYGHIDNNGLRWLVIDVYDNTTGVLTSVGHQHLRFAAYDAFPTGTVNTAGVVMSPHHSYVITVTPNGPRDSYCDVQDMLNRAIPPVAVIDVTSQVSLTVSVSGSGSYDLDGTIMEYAWTFGDGGVASGMAATHTYALLGTYDITLVVTDNDGLTSTTTKSVVLNDSPPTASFTITVTGATVNVDASLSSDDVGIVSYVWNWGDGTTLGSGMIASHTYSQPPAPAPGVSSTPSAPIALAPGPPYLLWGYTTDTLGNPVECYVTITNLRTGEVGHTDSFIVPPFPLDGYYEFDLQNGLPSAFLPGDQIKVDAVSASGILTGSTTESVPTELGGSMNVDVTVTGLATYTITLTVTDTIGQTSSFQMAATIQW
jgi:PKD repeat protein